MSVNVPRAAAHGWSPRAGSSEHAPCYGRDMRRFVRVAHRHGWEVELVEPDSAPETKTLASRDEALAYAESLDPDWIEIGDIVGLDTPAQQHSWTTLRRGENGSYSPSLLRWQVKRKHLEPREPDLTDN